MTKALLRYNAKIFFLSYCMNGLISMDEEDLTWVCEDCVGRFPELDSLNKHQSTSGKKALRHENSSFAINIIQNDREEDEARKDSNSKEMINGCEMNEVGYSNLYEDGGNHNPPTSSEDRGSPFPQGEEDCVNEDFHFMKRKRRRRLIIYESEEEIDDDLTSSDTSKEGDVRGNPSMCDMSPELKARPTIEPIWRGWFEICGHNYGMLLGHLSSKACLRVYEGAKLLEHVTRVEMLPRTDAWPKTFERSPPSSDSIGLYFFPENLCDEKMFDKLMNEINSQDLVLKVILDEVELLIFSSRLLPQSTRFCGKYYLWGAFRARKKPAISDHQSMGDDHRRIPNPKASSVWEEEIKGQGCGKTSRSDLGQREMRVEGRSASDRNGMSRGIARPARFRRRPRPILRQYVEPSDLSPSSVQTVLQLPSRRTATTSSRSESTSVFAASETLYGIFLLRFSPTLAKIIGLADYDFAVIDMEHGPDGISDALPSLHALAATGTLAILRVPESTGAWAKKALDLGPQGIMFPMIKGPKSTPKAVSYCKFPSNDIRGSAHPLVRASKYGIDEGYLENY
ncbi:hypothetical protein ACLOJK_001033 [Asimina triloba]